jgi:hypothetical protein
MEKLDMNVNRRIRTLYVLSFPIVLTIGILLIPVVPDYADHALAVEAVEGTERWFTGHLISAVAFGLSVLACSVIVAVLERNSYAVQSLVLPLIAIGAGLYAAGLGADGIGPIAVKSSGTSPLAFFDGSGWWVSGVFIAGTLFFGVGLITLVIRVNKSGLVGGVWRYVIFICALIFVSAPAIPSGWALYAEAIAAIGIFVPIGVFIGRTS